MARVSISAYVNGDDCFVFWSHPDDPKCWGFAISRQLTTAAGTKRSGFLDNRVGFAKDDPKPHEHRPSTEWPFQRYTWTDHGVGEGDVATYTVTPVLKQSSGLVLDQSGAAAVGPLTVTARSPKSVSAYFNRGVLLSQFISNRLPENFTKGDLIRLKNQLAKDDDSLRTFLMGQVGSQLLKLLTEVSAKKGHLYAALYELSDATLIQQLARIGKRAHLVLSNGSSKKKGTDGNSTAAKSLDGVVDLHRRMLWSEGLGHNKFAVFARSPNEPFAVWTGSTNWATTGLCTQLNNSILVEDAELAKAYLEQWKRLRDDRRTGAQGQDLHFGPVLVGANDASKTGAMGKSTWTLWFTRTSAGQDIEAAAQVINAAKRAVFFLMFEPGSAGLLQVVQARLSPASRTYDKSLLVHGVVNTLRASGGTVAVDLVSRGQNQPCDLRVVQPEGIGEGLAQWAAEVTRSDFLMGPDRGVIGHAIIHSKVIVVDPFSDPVVITGSHNFSHPASAANDENLLIVKGNKDLAERYVVNIMGTYQHYRWRKYLYDCHQQKRSPWQHLTDGPDWQARQADHDPELRFWLQQA